MNNNTDNGRRGIRGIEHWKQISAYLIIYDAFVVMLSYFLALLIRFDFAFSRIPTAYYQAWLYFSPVYAVICVVVFWKLKLYRSIWRFASFTELERITTATVITTVLHIIGINLVLNSLIENSAYTLSRMPLSYYLIGAVFQALFVTAIRFSYRFILLLRASRAKKSAARVMLIGMHSIIGTT